MPATPIQTNNPDALLTVELAPPRPPLPEPFWTAHAWEIAAGFALAVIGLALWIRLARRTPTPPAVPPPVQARHDLQALSRRPADPVLAADTARIIRHYLILRLGLPREEWTTTELCDALQARQDVPSDITALAGGFLRKCDRLRFAPGPAVSGDDLVAGALNVVERLERACSADHGGRP